ncbi:MAG: Histidine kinase [Verrucomicrobia bacterium]|nr:Histidine kinase [Verrucomicrobiota bacterium]
MTSIRQRLSRSLLVVLFLLLGGGLAAVYFLVRAELFESFDRTLLAKAQAISTLVFQDGDEVSLNFSDKFMRGFDSGVAREFFEVWRSDGVSVKRSESLGNEHLPNIVRDFKKPKKWSLMLPKGQMGRALGVEFTPRGSSKASTLANTGTLHLVVAASRGDIDEDLREIQFITIGMGLLLIALTAWIVPGVLRRQLRPLERLADDVEKINADSLTLRFPTDDVPRELDTITRRLNALLERLENSFERERRVSGAMAHELRTPIAELRNLAECALKWPESRDPETDRDALAIAQQMELIVTRLLALARSESGRAQPVVEPVDLVTAITQAWQPLAARAEEKHCRVSLQAASLVVSTDSVLLRSILTNLLENAVEYCPANGAIGIELRPGAGGNFSLAISNPAPDLTPADAGRLFERFWRKESSRSDSSHAGLGLSLVRAFAQALGWETSAKLTAESVLIFTLSGPASRAVP